jgi:hypothetical protein
MQNREWDSEEKALGRRGADIEERLDKVDRQIGAYHRTKA